MIHDIPITPETCTVLGYFVNIDHKYYRIAMVRAVKLKGRWHWRWELEKWSSAEAIQ